MASYQPNVPGQGIVAGYSPRFWGAVVGLGVATGLAGAALVELLELVQHLAWDYEHGTFLAGVTATSSARHVAVLVLAGAISGVAMLALRRLRLSGGGEVSEDLWLRGGRLPVGASLVRGALSVVTVGMGSSLGREAAPQLAGAAFAGNLARRIALPSDQCRLLVASGAGAGMAAVYDVPLGGALFALEVLLGTLSLPLVVPALGMTLTATATAWVTLPTHPVYDIPAYHVSAALVAFAVVAGPVAGFAAVAWVRGIATANARRPDAPAGRVVAPIVVFGALGALAIPYPQLLGNGIDTVQLSMAGGLSVALLAALVVLKPLATVACLGSGSPGGLFTPTLAVGVLLGGLLGHAWSEVWPGSPIGGYAIVGGAAMLAASMQGPLAAIVLLLELTRRVDGLKVPMRLAVVLATIVSRVLDAPSLYSARMAEAASVPPAR